MGDSFSLSASKTVFQFQEDLGVLVVDGERAAVGAEIVVAQGGVELVVEGIVGTEAVINAAVGDIDIGKTL